MLQRGKYEDAVDMMGSGDCENISGTSMEGCSSMLKDSPEKHMDDHCGNKGDAGSMMGTKYKASTL